MNGVVKPRLRPDALTHPIFRARLPWKMPSQGPKPRGKRFIQHSTHPMPFEGLPLPPVPLLPHCWSSQTDADIPLSPEKAGPAKIHAQARTERPFPGDTCAQPARHPGLLRAFPTPFRVQTPIQTTAGCTRAAQSGLRARNSSPWIPTGAPGTPGKSPACWLTAPAR